MRRQRRFAVESLEDRVALNAGVDLPLVTRSPG